MALSVLFTFDYFALRPHLYFNGKYYYSTIFGSCLSIIILIGIFTFLTYYLLIVFHKKETKLITTIFNDENPQLIHLKKDNFALTISLQDVFYNNYINESIYTIKANKIKVVLNEDGTSTTYTSKINLIKCSEFSFQIIPDYFKQLPLDHLYCLNDTDMEIQGQFMQPIWQFINFEFSKCNKETSKVECAPDDIIEKMLHGGFIGMFITDFSIDTNNYSYPYYVYGRNVYNGFSEFYYIDLWIYLKPIEIITDEGILFTKTKKQNVFAYESMKHDVYFKDGDVFASVTIRDSPKREVYERSYTKIQDVGAIIGGIVNLCLTLGEWCIYFIKFLLYKNYFLQFFNENTVIFYENIQKNSKKKTIDDNKIEIKNYNSNKNYKKSDSNYIININFNDNKNSSSNLFNNSNINKNNISKRKKSNNEIVSNFKIKKNINSNLSLNNNNLIFQNQDYNKKPILKKNLLNCDNELDNMINYDYDLSKSFLFLMQNNKEYFKKKPPKIIDERSIILLCCQKNAWNKIKNINKKFSKINYLFDLIYIIKTRNEINIIENILFNKEQKNILSGLYKFNSNFLIERIGFEENVKHNK
jgi:hypothetical protein